MNESIFLVLLICGHRTGAENKILAFGYRFWYIFTPHAGIAQLVERNLAKVDVAGSSPVSRSVLYPDEGEGHLSASCHALWLSESLPL